MEKIFNIEVLKSDVEKTSRVLKNSCDLILMTNLLFEVADIKKVLEEGKRVLKTGGKILAVDWKKDVPFGPKEKISPEKVKEIAKEIGLESEKEFEVSSYHWGLILVK